MVGGKGTGAAKAAAAIKAVVAPQGDHAAQHPVKAPRPRRQPKPAIHDLIVKPATPIVSEHGSGQGRRPYKPPADYGQSTRLPGSKGAPPRATPARVKAYRASHPDTLPNLAAPAELVARNAALGVGAAIGAPLIAPALLASRSARALGAGQTKQAGIGDLSVLEAGGKQLYGEGRHPLRHPVNTTLDALALLSGGAGVVARGAEASRAVNAIEKARVAVKADELAKPGTAAIAGQSKTRAAGEAFMKRPSPDALTPQRLRSGTPGVRTVKHLKGSEQFRQSPNPVAGLAQNAADRYAEAHPHTPVVGAVARIARQGRKTVAIQQHRIASLAIPFGEASKDIATGSPHDVAMGRLISYGVDDPRRAAELLDKEIATHRARAALPVEAPTYVTRGGKKVLVQPKGTISPVEHRDLTAQADALEKAKPFMADPKVVAAARIGRDLANVTGAMRVEGGHLTEETAARSVPRRAQLASGGHILTPAEARAEIQAENRRIRQLDAEKKQVQRKIKRTVKTAAPNVERSVAQERTVSAEAERASKTRADLAARTAAAEAKLAKAEQANYGAQVRYSAEGKKVSQVVARAQTVGAARKEVQAAKAAERVARREAPNIAAAQTHLAARSRAERIAARVQQERTLRGHAESLSRIARERAAAQDRAAAIHAFNMTGAQGVTAGEGAAFLPSLPRTERTITGAGGGAPLGKPRRLIHQATGTLFEQGREELSGKRMVTSHFFSTAKRAVQDRTVAEKIAPLSLPIKPGDTLLPGHTLFNPAGLKVARRTREMDPSSIIEASTPQEIKQATADLHQHDLHAHGELFPAGTKGEAGLRQVDKRIAESYHPAPSISATGMAGHLRDVLDATNNITRAALIYLNPSYIPRNYAGNMAFLALHQGPFMFQNLAQASKTLGKLKLDTLHRIDNEVQGGAAQAMLEASTGRRIGMTQVAHFQNRVADQGPRRAAWIHEAAARGYKTPERIHLLLTDKTLEPVLNQVSMDARRAMVDFGDLTPTERKVLQRAIFIYPWLKGATRYVKDLVVDRPVAAAIAAHVSAEAGKLQRKAYGSIDARLSNVMPVGAARTAFGTTVLPVRNITSISPIGQGEDVAKAAYHAVAGGGSVQNFLDQFLQPGFSAGIAAVHPPQGQSALTAFTHNLVGTPQRPNFPLAGLIKYAASKDQGPVKGPASKQADYIQQGARGHGVWGWLKGVGEYAALGSARERLLNVPAAQTKSASAGNRAAARANALVDHARVVIGDKRVPVYVHRAANAVALHASNRANHPNTAQGHAAADLETAVALRKITRAQADTYKQEWAKLGDTNVTNLLNSFAGSWFGGSAGVVGQYLGRAAALENARQAIHK